MSLQPLKLSLLLSASACLLTACPCTKMYCENDSHPVIHLKFVNFSDKELSKQTIYWVNPTSFEILDSVKGGNQKQIELSSRDLSNKPFELKDYAYIIKTDNTSDTIKKITYEWYEYKTACNKCFPFGHDEVVLDDFKDFSYQHENIMYYREDTLTIKPL